jgi:hypothetical protein
MFASNHRPINALIREGQPAGQHAALDRQAGTEKSSSDLALVAVDLSGDLALTAKAAGLELRFVLIGVAYVRVIPER